MELKYPRAMRGTTNDVIRIGRHERGSVFMVDPTAFKEVVHWGILIHDLATHVAIALEGGVTTLDGTKPSRVDILRLLGEVFAGEQARDDMGLGDVDAPPKEGSS